MRTQTKNISVVIHRPTKREAEQAIAELQKRGFELVFPLTERCNDGKRFSVDGYRRKFVENFQSSYWIAKLRRVE